MKIVLAAINAKYIHANLAVCSLRAFSDEYKEQIQIKEYTINQYTEDILADLYKEKADMVAFSCYIWNWELVQQIIGELEGFLVLHDAVAIRYDTEYSIIGTADVGTIAGDNGLIFRIDVAALDLPIQTSQL